MPALRWGDLSESCSGPLARASERLGRSLVRGRCEVLEDSPRGTGRSEIDSRLDRPPLRGGVVIDPSTCSHSTPRFEGIVPLVCGVCGGVEIARATSTFCRDCGTTFRDPGWERWQGEQWLYAKTVHERGLEHQARAARAAQDDARESPEPSALIAPLVATAPPSEPGPQVVPRPTDESLAERPALTPPASPPTTRPEPLSVGASSPPTPTVRPQSTASSEISPKPAPSQAPWSATDRIACPKGCGLLLRRDNVARHVKRRHRPHGRRSLAPATAHTHPPPLGRVP